MYLYHFSDEPGLLRFEPRSVVTDRPPGREWLNGPLVWAIDEWHSPLYYFPRDCPRILAWPLPTTTDDDRARWLGESGARIVAWLEEAWLDRLRAAHLWRYTFAPARFQALGDAGMWVSRESAEPVACDRLQDLPVLLAEAAVELRVVPSLLPQRGAWESTLHVSGIRLRNAAGWNAS